MPTTSVAQPSRQWSVPHTSKHPGSRRLFAPGSLTVGLTHFGRSKGEVDLVPKPPFDRTPAIAVGRAQQSSDWIARHMDGFIAPSPPVDQLDSFASAWRSAVEAAHGEGAFRPLGIAGYLDLVEDRDHPLQQLRAGFRSGSRALVAFLRRAQAAGIHHVAFNPKVSRRPYGDLMS